MTGTSYSQGASLTDEGGVSYSVWAPARKAAARILPKDGQPERRLPLTRDAQGFHRGTDTQGQAGDRYLFELDGRAFPCPASRWQPEGVHGPSLVVDAGAFAWTDQQWSKPPFRDLVIYELHIGTFTPEGTFLGAIDKLGHLRDLGITAIEIMPVADFPGSRNWGYDGVRLYAPAQAYGRPDDFRALVDAAHTHGLAVILDVVYNHFGPDGNYLREFSPHYFEGRHHTPWGEAINFSQPEVRAYYAANLIYWMEDFHMDGFRLDATHTIFDDSKRHILAELAAVVHQRGCYIIAEDERTEPRIIANVADGGYGMNAVWADDFHHVAEVALIDASIYSSRYNGDLAELAATLRHGWIPATAAHSKDAGALPEAPPAFPPERFVFCISNHDQAGNRAFGERLNHFVPPATYRAASALLCLTPCTPLLFMGQEWGASTPFEFFTDHHGELGKLVEKGRLEELRRFPAFKELLAKGAAPSPQALETFERSRLNWQEMEKPGHHQCLQLYKRALKLRREHPAFRPNDRSDFQVFELHCGVLGIRYNGAGEDWLVICDLEGGHSGNLRTEPAGHLAHQRQWQFRFSSEDHRFGGGGGASYDETTCALHFTKPELIVLQA